MKELISSLTRNVTPDTMQTILVNSRVSAVLTEARIEQNMDTYQFANHLGVKHDKFMQWLEDGYDFSVSEICYILNKVHKKLDIAL